MRCSSHSQHRVATNRERKLTGTLILVTLASELSWLPYIIFGAITLHKSDIANINLSLLSFFHIRMTLIVLAAANSLANPIIYAARMPEFMAGVAKLFRRVPNRINLVNLPLENLQG